MVCIEIYEKICFHFHRNELMIRESPGYKHFLFIKNVIDTTCSLLFEKIKDGSMSKKSSILFLDIKNVIHN